MAFEALEATIAVAHCPAAAAGGIGSARLGRAKLDEASGGESSIEISNL